MLYDMQGYLKDNVQKYLTVTGLKKEQLRRAKTPFIDESQYYNTSEAVHALELQ